MAMDAPPTEIKVGGAVYPINTDFKIWIEVGEKLRELLPTMENEEDLAHNALVLTQLCEMVVGIAAPWTQGENYMEFLREIGMFMAGYPHAPVNAGESGTRTYSFEWDLNEIIMAILCQYGVDLRFGAECHWWIFLEYFRCLAGEHQILKLMEIRRYDGKDAELKKRAARFALPKAQTAQDARTIREINDLFYNC